ncbi:MAG: diguanylate cyclase [Planctomycetia bacterium]|nr:diguanylate cyclase [Planctomycetia bacterium]
MRLNKKNIRIIFILLILIVSLFPIQFLKTGLKMTFIYLIITGIITVLGFLFWELFNKEKVKRIKHSLDLPNSKLSENPKIPFNKTLKLIGEQLKTIKPQFKFAIYLIDPESNSFVLQDMSAEYFSSSINIKNKIFHKIFNEDQTLLIKPNEYQDQWTELFTDTEANNSNCLLGAKISYNKSPIGCLFAFVDDVRRIESNDQIIVRQFADQVTLALSLIDNIESLQKHHTIQEKIFSLVNNVNISENKSIIYEKVVEICQSIFKYDKLTIMVSYQDIEHARIEFVDGYSLDISIDEVFSLKNSIFANVIQNNKIINSKDIKKDFGKRYRFYDDEITQRNISSVLAVPIIINQDVSGCIALERFEEMKYSAISLYYLEMIVRTLNRLLQWQSEYHKMYLNTTHDNLTGLLNYRAFLNRLDIEMNRTLRTDQSLVIIIADVDRFKRINDTFGHQIGNIALKKIADLISSSVRNIDVVARYGGEEFIIAISNSTKNGAEQIAERIVNNIANNIFIFDDQRIKITLSAGMAEFPNDSDQVQKLIDAADKAMYNAKKHGGNTFCL